MCEELGEDICALNVFVSTRYYAYLENCAERTTRPVLPASTAAAIFVDIILNVLLAVERVSQDALRGYDVVSERFCNAYTRLISSGTLMITDRPAEVRHHWNRAMARSRSTSA